MSKAPAIYAEDDPNDAYFMRHAFQKGGVTTPLLVLADGQQVIDYLSGIGPYGDRCTHPFPCLLLLDLKLPRKSGFEVLEWIGEQRLPMKVIVISSSGQASDVELAKKLGALDYIIKPSSPAKLAETVRQMRQTWLDAVPNGSSV